MISNPLRLAKPSPLKREAARTSFELVKNSLLKMIMRRLSMTDHYERRVISSLSFSLKIISYSFALAALLMFLAVTSPSVAARANDYKIENCRFVPMAIFNDGKDKATITVQLSRHVSRVSFYNDYSPDQLIVDGKLVSEFWLYDDGTHGDKVAGDNIYTRSNIRSNFKENARIWTRLRIRDLNGKEKVFEYLSSLLSNLFIVDKSQQQKVTKINSKWRRTKWIANFKDSGKIQPIKDDVHDTPAPDLKLMAKEFYKIFPDKFDFLTVYSTTPDSGFYFHVNVRNDVTGLGDSKFDYTKLYGSNGKLRGINFLRDVGGPHMHEMTHQWGVFLKNPEVRTEVHWGAVNVPGYLWGMDFRNNGNGTFTVTRNYTYGPKDGKYPPIEMYMLGLIPANQVPNIIALKGIDPRAYNEGDVIKPASYTTISIQDIIAANGPRVPSFQNSPRKFREAGILITHKRFASDAELALFSIYQKHFGSKDSEPLLKFGILIPSFHYATSGKAKIKTRIGKPKKN